MAMARQRQELGSDSYVAAEAAATAQKSRGGGDLAVAATMRTTRMVSAVVTVMMTATADDGVGGMAITG